MRRKEKNLRPNKIFSPLRPCFHLFSPPHFIRDSQEEALEVMLLVLLVTIVIRRGYVLGHGDGFRWVNGRPDLFNHRVETVVVIGRVLDDSHASVGLVDAVRTVNHVPVADLVLGLHVPCVRIVDAIVEHVLGMGL